MCAWPCAPLHRPAAAQFRCRRAARQARRASTRSSRAAWASSSWRWWSASWTRSTTRRCAAHCAVLYCTRAGWLATRHWPCCAGGHAAAPAARLCAPSLRRAPRARAPLTPPIGNLAEPAAPTRPAPPCPPPRPTPAPGALRAHPRHPRALPARHVRLPALLRAVAAGGGALRPEPRGPAHRACPGVVVGGAERGGRHRRVRATRAAHGCAGRGRACARGARGARGCGLATRVRAWRS